MSILRDFKKVLSLIDQRDKDLVFGYCRTTEHILQSICIPPLVVNTILPFYYSAEYFCKAGDDIEISNKNMTITKIATQLSWRNSAYCNVWIDSMSNSIVSWQFIIDNGTHMSFGFVSHDNCCNSYYSNVEDRPVYEYNISGRVEVNGMHHRTLGDVLRPTAGETFEVTLDLRNRNAFLCILPKRNGKHVIFEDIVIGKDIRYKMVVSLCNIKYQLTLNKFAFLD
eukprot:UN02940